MNRPYVICHMTISLDGKVTGEHLVRSNHSPASMRSTAITRRMPMPAGASLWRAVSPEAGIPI